MTQNEERTVTLYDLLLELEELRVVVAHLLAENMSLRREREA